MSPRRRGETVMLAPDPTALPAWPLACFSSGGPTWTRGDCGADRMTRRGGWLLLGMVVGAAASARVVRADGLAGLDAKLRDTGRVGTLSPPALRPIQAATPDAGADDRARDPRRARDRIEADDTAADGATDAAHPTGIAEEEL